MTFLLLRPTAGGSFRERAAEALRAMRGDIMIKRFLQNETGLELSEYAVAAALVAIAAAGVFMALGDAITVRINELAGHITAGK